MKFSLKKLFKFFAFIIILLVAIVLACNFWVNYNSKSRNFYTLNDLPNCKVGILLGTSKFLLNGQENYYYKYRIDAAVELLKSGKIKYIVVSGDNGHKNYDEPTQMKQDLVSRGIDSTKIYPDYAGFRTLDSMVRLQKIFGQSKTIVISQKFHNQRAIYIGDKIGLETYGYNAKDVGKSFGLKTQLREKLARVKVVLDFIFKTQPKFLGEKIEIP